MRQEQFKMERQGLIQVGDVVEISEFQSYMNYSYIIEPAVILIGICTFLFSTGGCNVRMLQKL